MLDATTGNNGFLDDGREQDALRAFLTALHPDLATAFDEADVPAGEDVRIVPLHTLPGEAAN